LFSFGDLSCTFGDPNKGARKQREWDQIKRRKADNPKVQERKTGSRDEKQKEKCKMNEKSSNTRGFQKRTRFRRFDTVAESERRIKHNVNITKYNQIQTRKVKCCTIPENENRVNEVGNETKKTHQKTKSYKPDTPTESSGDDHRT
jgi:hypothetical protein